MDLSRNGQVSGRPQPFRRIRRKAGAPGLHSSRQERCARVPSGQRRVVHAVQRALQDHCRCNLVDHGRSPPPRGIRFEQHTLGSRRRQAFVPAQNGELRQLSQMTDNGPRGLGARALVMSSWPRWPQRWPWQGASPSPNRRRSRPPRPGNGRPPGWERHLPWPSIGPTRPPEPDQWRG